MAFATAIAEEVPADEITSAEILIGNSAGIAISLITRIVNATSAAITTGNRLLIFLQAEKLDGYKFSTAISKLAVASAKCSLYRQHGTPCR